MCQMTGKPPTAGRRLRGHGFQALVRGAVRGESIHVYVCVQVGAACMCVVCGSVPARMGVPTYACTYAHVYVRVWVCVCVYASRECAPQ